MPSNSKKYVWVTDTHLDHLCFDGVPKDDRWDNFVQELNNRSPEAVIITGDISNALYIKDHLKLLEQQLTTSKVFFILGNHDFYGGSIEKVRKSMVEEVSSEKMVYLSSLGYVPLTETTALVGHDGWYDGLYANWFAPNVVLMNDYLVIKEMRDVWFGSYSDASLNKQRTHTLMGKLAKECEFHIHKNLSEAAKTHKTVLFATHVPPFAENSRYRGAVSSPAWLPNFSSKYAGDALLEVAKAHPDNQFIVLCGHSHGNALFKPLRNLECHTGFAEYGFPEASIKVLEIE